MPTTQYGMAIRLDPNKVTDGLPHSDMRDAVVNRMTNTIMIELSNRTQPDGKRIVNPHVRIICEPQRMKFDLVVELDENERAVQWMNNNFNSTNFRRNLIEGINKQLIEWARKKYSGVLKIDQYSIAVE